jgi:DNA-binding NarL/FixJ family response regulator
MATRVVLADDHALLREEVKRLLARAGIDVVGEAENGVELIQMADELRPNIVVTDISMPLINGLEAAAEILRDLRIPSIVMTIHTDPGYVLRALGCGSAGYILKSRVGTCLVEAIREVCAGKMYVSSGISGDLHLSGRAFRAHSCL